MRTLVRLQTSVWSSTLSRSAFACRSLLSFHSLCHSNDSLQGEGRRVGIHAPGRPKAAAQNSREGKGCIRGGQRVSSGWYSTVRHACVVYIGTATPMLDICTCIVVSGFCIGTAYGCSVYHPRLMLLSTNFSEVPVLYAICLHGRQGKGGAYLMPILVTGE